LITFATSTSGRRYSTKDVWLAEELARRAALAVDNARLYREAQEANRAKSQFLATMSHELRTPLNAIGGYAELLQMGLRGPISAEQQEDLNRIQRSQRHLLGLINDLLSFAKIESGHLELQIERVIVRDAVSSVEALIQPQVTSKPLHYKRASDDSSIACMADLDKLHQVLANLLSNAVKFTPAGGNIVVGWGALGDVVSIDVTDTGPGIPATKLEAIFEPFVQLGGNLTRVAEGTGLGLAISRELARAMGGDVTVRSTLGAGSSFTLTLPRA
jgi:signal transduction histidine kinase